MSGLWSRFLSLPLWAQYTIAVALGLVLIGGIASVGGDDEEDTAATQSTTTQSTTTQTATTAPTATVVSDPAPTLQAAQQAVDEDDFAQAVAIATVLGAAQLNAIRRRISNRIARQTLLALRSGNRARAQTLLRRADIYPTTNLTRQARSSYRAASARAAARVRARQEARAQRRRERAARRQAEREAARQREREQSEPSTPSAPSVPGGACSDTPQTDFPVPPGDPRDRDGDGIACES